MHEGLLAPVPAQPRNANVVLRLYVAGSTPKSSRAITQVKNLCETHLKDSYVLTVMDLYEQSELARADQITVAPTLIRLSPLPERRLTGDLSQSSRLFSSLDLPPAPLHPPHL